MDQSASRYKCVKPNLNVQNITNVNKRVYCEKNNKR